MNLLGVEDDPSAAGGAGQTSKKAHIGQLNLPIIIEDSIDIYLSTDKIYSNRPENLVNQLYYSHSSGGVVDEN